ncbi:MAG TPA: tetratricopeptide repeat protein, partial [Chitinophagales bacterium]|nr:tetratricopeptide repeat protein [Chitinophagales bacterium]
MNKLLSSKTFGAAFVAGAMLLSGCAKMHYNAGNRYYNNLAYDAAAKRFEKAVAANPDMPEAKRKLADSYREMRNTVAAEKWYTEVVNQPDATAADRYNAARAMMANGNYTDARVQLKQYLDQVPADQGAQKLYASLDSIGAWKADSAAYVIETPNLNSEASMNPNYFKDGLVFASDRGGSKEKHEWSGRPFQDIYFAKETSPGSFDKAMKMGKEINTRYHDATPVVTTDGKTMFFTRTNMKKKNAKRGDGGLVVLKLMQATRMDTGWTDITELPFNSDNYSTGQPAVSADGNTLYFVSDMPGGQGGTDIYMSRREGSGWGAPQNLGSAVNTPFDEMFPTINQGDLYFS